jgi:hypothetical protein
MRPALVKSDTSPSHTLSPSEISVEVFGAWSCRSCAVTIIGQTKDDRQAVEQLLSEQRVTRLDPGIVQGHLIPVE